MQLNGRVLGCEPSDLGSTPDVSTGGGVGLGRAAVLQNCVSSLGMSRTWITVVGLKAQINASIRARRPGSRSNP